jgi:hypothetical protein
MNRTRKGTILHNPQLEKETEVPQDTFEGSPTVTLKNIIRPREKEVDERTDEEPQPTSSSLLETPTIDYDDESPSQAKLRFQRAYLLVTKELRQRVAHLRKSPITPEIPDAPRPSEPFSVSPKNPEISFTTLKQDIHPPEATSNIESPGFLDQYYTSPEGEEHAQSGSASPVQEDISLRRNSSRSIKRYYSPPKSRNRGTIGSIDLTEEISSPHTESPTSIEHYYASPKNSIHVQSESMNSVVKAVNSQTESPKSIENSYQIPTGHDHPHSEFITPTEEPTSSRPWLKPFRLVGKIIVLNNKLTLSIVNVRNATVSCRARAEQQGQATFQQSIIECGDII